MAEVQDLAKPPLALVRVHHVALDLDVAADYVRKLLAVEALGVDGMRRQAAEQRLVADDAVLDDLTARVREELRRERVQAVHVRDDERRLEERAGEVLAGLEVDGGLSADGGVHHGQKRRGHLHDLAPAQVQRRGESAHVAGDTAADRDDDVVARKLGRGEALEQVREGGEALVLLARGKHLERRAVAGVRKRLRHGVRVQRRHVVVRDDARR